MTSRVARASPDAARFMSCLIAASSLVMRFRRPFSVTSTFSLSAAATIVLKLRAPFGRPLGLPDWPGRKGIPRGVREPAPSANALPSPADPGT